MPKRKKYTQQKDSKHKSIHKKKKKRRKNHDSGYVDVESIMRFECLNDMLYFWIKFVGHSNPYRVPFIDCRCDKMIVEYMRTYDGNDRDDIINYLESNNKNIKKLDIFGNNKKRSVEISKRKKRRIGKNKEKKRIEKEVLEKQAKELEKKIIEKKKERERKEKKKKTKREREKKKETKILKEQAEEEVKMSIEKEKKMIEKQAKDDEKKRIERKNRIFKKQAEEKEKRRIEREKNAKENKVEIKNIPLPKPKIFSFSYDELYIHQDINKMPNEDTIQYSASTNDMFGDDSEYYTDDEMLAKWDEFNNSSGLIDVVMLE